MKLVWRISPPSGLSASSSRPSAAHSAEGLLYTTSSTSGKTDLLVWDVEDRSLLYQVSLELDSVESLHVVQGTDGNPVSLLSSALQYFR